MGTISTGTLLTVMDSLAAGKMIFDAAMGTDGTEADTVSKAAANDVASLAAVTDIDVQADLAAIFRARAAGVMAESLYGSLGAYNLWWALDKHVGGLDLFLRTNDLRVSQHVQALGFPISAQQLLPPVVDPMATYAVSGTDTGTYTHVADIDSATYGKAWLQGVTTSLIGAATITATVNGLAWDQLTAVSKQITIAAGSSVGTSVNVGTLGVSADSINTITSITITGGTSGDAFKIRSRAERVISAAS